MFFKFINLVFYFISMVNAMFINLGPIFVKKVVDNSIQFF